MKRYLIILILFVLCGLYACKQQKPTETKMEAATPEIDMDNLIAWCIVPFDIKERTPQQRIDMLKELGFTNYAYDWRTKHLSEMALEWNLAKENGIKVGAVWMWVDGNTEKPGQLGEDNETVLKTIKDTGLKTQIWAGFQSNFFEGLEEPAAIEKGVAMVDYLNQRVTEIGCELALYNHGDWFGEPENQVKILERLPDENIGIIYNFHHGHGQIDRFPEMLSAMQPYLFTVNLNGMVKDGPKILPIGKGDYEKQMLQTLKQAGYTGPFGILGHVEDADVKVILQRNLEGFREINK